MGPRCAEEGAWVWKSREGSRRAVPREQMWGSREHRGCVGGGNDHHEGTDQTQGPGGFEWPE